MDKITEKVFNRMSKTVKASPVTLDSIEYKISGFASDLMDFKQEKISLIDDYIKELRRIKDNTISSDDPKRLRIQKLINDLLGWKGQISRIEVI